MRKPGTVVQEVDRIRFDKTRARPQQPSVSPPPHKRARIDFIKIPSDATPAAVNSTPAQPLPPSLPHPSLQPPPAQSLHSHMPSSNSLAHLYDMVQQHSLPPDALAALLNLLRSGAFQPGHFGPQQSSQNPGLSDSFLAPLAELASTNPGISDTIGTGLGGYGLGPGGSAFDWPTGLGSSSNAQEPSGISSQCRRTCQFRVAREYQCCEHAARLPLPPMPFSFSLFLIMSFQQCV